MKSTGVVRRVDDLGRVVIPKEIRRTLKIREGEELEIFVESDEIVFRKFSKIVDLGDVAKKLVDVVSSVIDKTILVTDRDKIVVGNGELKKKYLNKNISSQLESIIVARNIFIEKNVNNIELVDGEIDRYSYIICPIISFGDVIGSIVILSLSNDISEFDVVIGKMITQFLGKYVEE